MGYNYARAEKEWLAWKEKEEKQLRELGVDEDTIQRLHTYDWEQFKKERNYYRWQTNAGDTDLWISQEEIAPIESVEALLDDIEDEQLFQALRGLDKLTLEIMAERLNGYSYKQIAARHGMSEMSTVNRISRLRKKLKKFF